MTLKLCARPYFFLLLPGQSNSSKAKKKKNKQNDVIGSAKIPSLGNCNQLKETNHYILPVLLEYASAPFPIEILLQPFH